MLTNQTESSDRGIACPAFRGVLLRGDTKFSQSDRYKAQPGSSCNPDRVSGRKRQREEAIVVAREFQNQRLCFEQVVEFNYWPTACRKTFRMVVVKKNIAVEKGEKQLFDQVVYFFNFTNDWGSEADEIVLAANKRCDQGNLLAQLSGGVRALHAPVVSMESNWAYMVTTALAWNLKTGWVVTLPKQPGSWQKKHQEEKGWVLRLRLLMANMPCRPRNLRLLKAC